MSVLVSFKAPIYPTENVYKVSRSLRNMIDVRYSGQKNSDLKEYDDPLDINELIFSFPQSDISLMKCDTEGFIQINGNISLLRAFHSYIRQEQIIDTAFSCLSEGLSPDRTQTTFCLNKQVAYVKKVNFPADAEPLGSI